MVEVKSIPFGNHIVQVFQLINSYNGYQQHVLFFGEIYLPQNTVTHALIKHHKFIIEQQFALYTKPNYKKPHHKRPQFLGYCNYYDAKPITWQTQTHHITPHIDVLHHGHYSVPIQEPVVEVYPMTVQDFNHLKSAIENQWFSDEKKVVLRQALADGHMLTTSQVKKIIELFNFSGDRLEIAKIAYVNTIDRENYFQVYSSLQYNSSVQNLSNYIASL